MTVEERQILQLLAKEWKLKGPPGILDVSDVVAALPLAPSDTLAALKHHQFLRQALAQIAS